MKPLLQRTGSNRLAKPHYKLVVFGDLLLDGLLIVVVIRHSRMHVRKCEMRKMREDFIGRFTCLSKHRNVPNPDACADNTRLSPAYAWRGRDVLSVLCNWCDGHIFDYSDSRCCQAMKIYEPGYDTTYGGAFYAAGRNASNSLGSAFNPRRIALDTA